MTMLGTMTVLVGYSSKYGATEGIAERIASVLRDFGIPTDARRVASVRNVSDYSVCIVGSSSYLGSWRPEASRFVRRYRSELATRPVWLFSSGPLGIAQTGAQHLREVTEARPKQFDEFVETIRPRGTQVFYGALYPERLDRRDRLVRKMPAGFEILPAGDFREWGAIEAWATGISGELVHTFAETK